jgi:hypothetical protein
MFKSKIESEILVKLRKIWVTHTSSKVKIYMGLGRDVRNKPMGKQG